MTDLPARYNAAETFIDSHRGVRESSVAIRCQGKSVTYGELAASVDRFGNALRELAVGLEQRVVILCVDSPEFVYAFFGAIKIGAVKRTVGFSWVMSEYTRSGVARSGLYTLEAPTANGKKTPFPRP